MIKPYAFNCYLIGEDSLLIQCAEILLAQQQIILGIISPLKLVKDWALENKISYFDSLELAKDQLVNTTYDYLFSIINSQVLPQALFDRCRHFAINFHDSPLPCLAGVNATCWAIIKNEKQHGITWHIINSLIDGGDILKQVIFDIDPDETALSLNLKCYQHAIDAFSPLVSELANQTYQRHLQNLSKRTYYGLSQKPPGNGWITWQDSAENIDRLCRALYFKNYTNRFSIAKFMLGKEVFVIEQWQIGENSDKPPGTLIKVSSDRWEIATTTKNFILLQISTLRGQPCDFAVVAKQHQLIKNVLLDLPNPTLVALLEKTSAALFKHENFWLQELVHFKAATLPFLTHNCLAKNNLQTKLQVWSLPESLKEKLPVIYPQISLITMLLTAWLVYLYRLGNQEHLGIKLHCQNDESNISPDLAAFFSSSVPFFVSLEDKMSFTQVMQQVETKWNLLKLHITYDRSISRRYTELVKQASFFPLAVAITDQPELELAKNSEKSLVNLFISTDGTQLSWFIDNQLIELEPNLLAIINNFPNHLDTLLQSVINKNSTTIAELNFLPLAEQQKILVEWNQTKSDYPKNKVISQLFEEQVKKTPQNTAVTYGKYQLTYEVVNQKANQLANYLRYQNIKPGDFISIYIERCLEIVTIIMGILKAGAAYIPIAENLPLQNIKSILNDSNSKLLITTKNLEKKIKRICEHQGFLIKIVCIDIEWPRINEFSNKNLSILATPKNIAYVIYTSGTTGVPKGVMIAHESLINLVTYQVKKFQINETSKNLQFASIGFDVAVSEIFTTLIAGATLCIFTQKKLLVKYALSNFIKKNKITHLSLTPSVLDTLCPSKLKTIKIVVIGGEILSTELANRWSAYFNVINVYGPTECTVSATMYMLTKHINASPSIGKPIANTKVYVLDKYFNPVPIGVTCELYLGGTGLAKGYLNQPKLTEQKFIKNLFDPHSISMLYRTGDLVRWLPDGNLEYRGRSDNQVKVRGFRLELEAIETQILNYKGVNHCAVMAQKDKNNINYLVAYLVINEAYFDMAVFNRFLSKKLPNYAIPSLFIKLDKFSLTQNGKIDRQALPASCSNKQFRDVNYATPKSFLEKRIHRIWSDILGIEQIGINDSFFHLGGHSLLLTKLALNLTTEFNYNLSLQSFLKSPTIASLAKLIMHNNKYEYKNDEETIDEEIINEEIINDIKLDTAIKSLLVNHKKKKPKSILITGATGFLGAHLLYDLYHLTNVNIYCLVRCDTEALGTLKLKAILDSYQLTIKYWQRIQVIKGDLAAFKLGISEQQFELLSEEIDIIYHSGAYVHHLYDYKALRSVNVLGTIELLKLATLKKNKSLHYVSTLSALIDFTQQSNSITEDFIDLANMPNSALNGYNQTKWVSEYLLAQACKRGVNIKIYRPGWILGHSISGIILSTNNHLLSLLKGCIQLGYAPIFDEKLSILPVDFVSRCIAEFSIRNDIATPVFNLANPNTLSWLELIHFTNNYGHPIDLIPYKDWQKHIVNLKSNNALYALLSLYINHESEILHKVKYHYCISNTVTAINKLNINFPKIEYALLKKYFKFLEADKFLPNKSYKLKSC